MKSKSIELKVEGFRDGKELSPKLLDIDEVVTLLSNARDFLFPEKTQQRPRTSVSLEEGSVLIKLLVNTAIAVQSQALLQELNSSHDLGLLKPKQVEAIKQIHNFISKEGFTVQFGLSEKLNEGLFINNKTEWKYPVEYWVDEELYIIGEITDVGGKTNPNVHIDTEEFGVLTVSSDKQILGDDDKNRLYKKQQLRIQIKRNLNTREYDKKSASLIEFIDFDEESSPDDYLTNLIEKSTPYWNKISDPKQWLENVRGYDG